MVHYIFIRHGITEWIEQGILHGISDSPLSTLGRWQAQQTAEALKGTQVDRIYASPLGRVMETTEPISKILMVPIQPLDGLKEMDFGFLEGKKDLYQRIKKYPKLLPILHVLRGFSGCLNGESATHFRKRVLETWQWIQKRHAQGTVMVVAHAGVLRVIYQRIFSRNQTDTPIWMSISECGITEMKIQPDGKAKIFQLNDTAHLTKEA